MWRIPYCLVATAFLGAWAWGITGHEVHYSGGYEMDPFVERVGLPLIAVAMLAALFIPWWRDRSRRSGTSE